MKVPLRIGSVLVTATLLVTALATPALAWSNGPGGPDSYGTHDWIPGDFRFGRVPVGCDLSGKGARLVIIIGWLTN